MRISDWSSDVCSSDLFLHGADAGGVRRGRLDLRMGAPDDAAGALAAADGRHRPPGAFLPDLGPRRGRRHLRHAARDRKSVVEGKSVAVRVELGGRRISKNTITAILPIQTSNIN